MSESLLRSHGLNPQRPAAIDSSMMKDFMDCESMFYLRHVLGLRKKYRSKAEDAKFDWGTAWHGLQENYWRALLDGDENAVVTGLSWLNSNWPDSVDPSTDKHKRSKERMIQIFFQYVEEKVPEILDEFETIRLEQFFHVVSERIGLEWSGRIDKLRIRRRNGKKVLWDYKTTSALGSSYFESHEFGFQIPGYVWMVNESSNESVDEAVLDVLYTLTASHQFLRRTFRYTPHDLREWEENVGRILHRMNYMLDNFLYDPDAWIKNKQECTRYGNCAFTDVHFTTPISDTRLRILENDYIEDRWDPINAANDSEVS